MTDLKSLILEYGQRARQAARTLARLGTEQKNAALRAMADRMVAATEIILEANRADLEKAGRDGLHAAMLERLTLNSEAGAGDGGGNSTGGRARGPGGKGDL